MNTRAKLYEYAIVWHPTDSQEKDGSFPMILVDLKRVLAKDPTTVQAIAARDIPAEYMGQINQIEILIRH